MISILNFEISLKCKKSTTNKCNCVRGKHIIMWHVLVLYYITFKVLWKYEKNNIVYAYMQSMNGCYSSIAISTQYDNMFTWTHGTQLYITIYLCTEGGNALYSQQSNDIFFTIVSLICVWIFHCNSSYLIPYPHLHISGFCEVCFFTCNVSNTLLFIFRDFSHLWFLGNTKFTNLLRKNHPIITNSQFGVK